MTYFNFPRCRYWILSQCFMKKYLIINSYNRLLGYSLLSGIQAKEPLQLLFLAHYLQVQVRSPAQALGFCSLLYYITTWHRQTDSSVTQSCLTVCNPMDCSTPGLPVHHQLLEFTQTYVHCIGDAIQPSHSLLSPSHPAFNLSQHHGLFKWVSS